MQVLREVPEGSGDLLRLRRVLCGSGGFWCRYLVRFRREVPEGSGDLLRLRRVLCGSGGFGADTL